MKFWDSSQPFPWDRCLLVTMPHRRSAKRRRITPPLDDSAISETIKASDLFSRAADWDLEQTYEKKARPKGKRETNRLPIKTAEGKITRAEEESLSEDS